MQRTLVAVLKGISYLVCFVPLIVVPSSFIFPFIVPKILLFRTLALILAGGYAVLLWADRRSYAPRLTPIAAALVAFLASFALSTFFGVDPYHSFWDNHERMLGLFTIIHYVLYFFVLGSVFRGWDDWRWALRIFLFAGSIVMAIAVYQHWHPHFLLNQGSDRAGSTLGNAIYVGGYGLFLFFAAFLLAVKDALARSLSWMSLEIALGVLAVFGLLFSGTRGSLLGLLVGLLCVGCGYGFALKHHPKGKKVFYASLAIFVVAGAGLFAYRETPAVANIPAVGRLLNTTLNGTLTTRSIAWKIAYDSWKERPVFGWGPNNYFYAFNAHYNPRSLEFGYGETWFDNAHNILLNTLAVQGILGFFSYLSIFAAALVAIFLAYKKHAIDAHIAVATGSFLVAHAAQNITVFENPTSYLYFMFWLALVNAMTRPSAPPEKGESAVPRRIGAPILSAAAAMVVLLIFMFNVQPARANMKTLYAMIAMGNNPALALPSVREALAFDSPHRDDIRSDLTRAMIDIVGNAYQRLEKETSNEMLELGSKALKENAGLHPRDIRIYILLAQLEQLRFVVNGETGALPRAEQALEQALTHSPRRQQLLFMLATMKAQIGKKDEAVALTTRALEDNPKIAESYWRLAYIHSVFNEHAKAAEAISLAKERRISIDAQGMQALNTFIIPRAKAAGILVPSP